MLTRQFTCVNTCSACQAQHHLRSQLALINYSNRRLQWSFLERWARTFDADIATGLAKQADPHGKAEMATLIQGCNSARVSAHDLLLSIMAVAQITLQLVCSYRERSEMAECAKVLQKGIVELSDHTLLERIENVLSQCFATHASNRRHKCGLPRMSWPKHARDICARP